jgi:hypothetical protein
MIAVIALGLALTSPHAVQAKTFHCGAGDVSCLIDAINTANANGQENTIRLAAGTYTLTAVDNNTRGPNGLPSITSTLTIRGAGAETTIIERQIQSSPFRLVHVEPTGTLTLRGLTLRGGLAAPSFPEDILGISGGILNDGTLTILHSVVSDNVAAFCCGGIGSSGTLLIDHSIISDNSSGRIGEVGEGGGIVGSGMLRITHSTITRNRGDGVSGGGIDFNGTLFLADSTISENRGTFGGGILTFIGTTYITNTTIANNLAFSGGGLFSGRATVFITNTTIANNLAFSGGGLFNDSGQLVLLNTILARNTFLDPPQSPSSSDCGGLVTSLGHNLIGDPTRCTITLQPSDLTGDPGFGAFTDDGTPGHGYFPLLQNSQAIDAGDDAVCPRRDQLGQRRVNIPRMGTSHCDIGAIEFPGKDDRHHGEEDDHPDEDLAAAVQVAQ